jgi:hypothetical protein
MTTIVARLASLGSRCLVILLAVGAGAAAIKVIASAAFKEA